ncbi:uncharacterized protein BO97DRAFT_429825 [Aspergillus homomorphus CBS 101889]|uniref:Uncharacterized protein n=1 Tax=Aspergillus homomorphus (strain CBS 101889) TaxID=1450537 RepID=A0A395HJ44_ASPHC|nr:hypothetical protein BO97DRAFT_429825 [Aspergillus homomorphus CBS 101889]RAL06918.1 hypothetical protein BO97DRAFT_429825 [Aspergillus homomorphus CBS 101889]
MLSEEHGVRVAVERVLGVRGPGAVNDWRFAKDVVCEILIQLRIDRSSTRTLRFGILKKHVKLVLAYWAMSIPPRPDSNSPLAIPPRNENSSASISSLDLINKVISLRSRDLSVDNP